MMLGVDFGTSNTVASVYDGTRLTYIPLDPTNQEDPHILNSLVYISEQGKELFGRPAMMEYFEQTAGRTVKLEKKSYGDIEMVFADMTHVAQGYYLEESNIPGRLFQYLKKHLGSTVKTNVFGKLYAPHELVALLLKHIKTTAERRLQREVESILLGRPVKFLRDADKNREAAKNLRAAALSAGFLQVEFQYEPVAAACNYALTARTQEHVLIFDFGGGTFDVTIVNIRNGQSNILGLSGVPVGGSDFDQSIMSEKIAPSFGKGQAVDHDHVVPANVFLDLLSWQTILQLNRNQRFLRNLENWIFYADDPRPFKALKRLVKEHHGFGVFQQIETAKKQLSTAAEAQIAYHVPELFGGEGAIHVDQWMSRNEFESLVSQYAEPIFDTIDEGLHSASLTARQIDRVVMVGGSSKIPFFHARLAEKFGREKLVMRDEFKNVAAGLAIEAFRLAQTSAAL